MSETQGPPITLRDMTVIVAREELAQRVREVPAGSNRGPRVDVYLREGGGLDPEGNHYPYCTSFVVYCILEAARRLGVATAYKPAASVQKIQARYPGLKIDHPEPGCIGQKLDAQGHGHTWLVVDVNLEAGVTHNIEGNTGPGPDVAAKDREGDGVWARTRAISEATAGFWRIA